MKARLSIVIALLVLAACGPRESIQVYRVVKSPTDKADMPSMDGMSMPPQPQGNKASFPISDQAPDGWTPQSLSAIRQASYLVNGKDGATADISLIVLQGPAGGFLENVNRWLSQIGQQPISQDKLAQITQHVKSPLGDVLLVDLQGTPDEAAKDGRILGGILTTGKSTYFYKIRGNAALVGDQKDAFIKWIASVKTSDSGGNKNIQALPVASAPERPKIKWDLPPHWQQQSQTTAMRYASFSIKGREGLDISIVFLPGEAGGDLDNVNRWRTQIGLSTITSAELATLVTPVKGKDATLSLVDMAGSGKRILAGWVRVDGNCWFIKLIGPDAPAAAEKVGFIKFLQSIQFHP